MSLYAQATRPAADWVAAPFYRCSGRGRRPDRSRYQRRPAGRPPGTTARRQSASDLEQRRPAHLEGLPVAAGARPAPFGPGRVTVVDRPADVGAEVRDPREHHRKRRWE